MRGKHLFSAFAILSLLTLSLLAITVMAENTSMVPRGETKRITLHKGESYQSDALSASALGVDSTYTITAIGVGRLTIEVRDCCLQGDTMFINASAALLCFPGSAYDEGVSNGPAGCDTWEECTTTAKVSFMVIIVAKITAQVGYTACPGGFPAGYWVHITFS